VKKFLTLFLVLFVSLVFASGDSEIHLKTDNTL